jgi:hypothetical protein
MVDYFTKIDGCHSFNEDSFSIERETIRYGLESGGVFYGIKYYEVKWLDEASPLDLFPESMRKDLIVRYMTINHAAYPHTDSGIEVSVNFYMNTTDEATNFYEFSVDDPTVGKLPNQTNGSVFSLDELKKVCSFNAKDGDIYILNVSKIHSVMDEKLVPLPKMRKAIVVNSAIYPYKALCESLKLAA